MFEAGDDTPLAAAGSPRPIVALGASAGGLEAFREFLEHTPHDTGMAFVIVQHMDPRQPSIVPELLATHTRMRVVQASDGAALEPNHVYVIPPNTALRTSQGRLCVFPGGDRRSAIDSFFRSLAEDQAHNAVGIVLSGVGSDGAVGLRAIKRQGGLALAQSPETARYDAMPRHAIETGLVDAVLSVERMPAQLVQYAAHLRKLSAEGVSAIEAAIDARLPALLQILHERTGHDFSRYKRRTLTRRVLRRLQVDQLPNVDAYYELLQSEPDRAEELLRDLLVSVTQFFRDPEAFEALKRDVLARLVREKPHEIRIWVPGCSTGEEAYSVAILLTEALEAARVSAHAQIFATDLDDQALDHARHARYPSSIQESISTLRLDRHFTRDDEGYLVVPRIREMCIFSQHDLIRDPPFSRLDLVSCRNVLIYLEPELQERVLELFHYSLNDGGRLFLGPSENLTGREELFKSLDKRHRIFSRKRAVLTRTPGFRATDPSRALRRASEARRSITPIGEHPARALESVLLDEFMPPMMVVNEQGDAIYVTGRTGKLIEPPAGALTLSAVNLVHRELRADLRSALGESIRTRETVQRQNLPVETSAGPEIVDLTVRPLTELGDGSLYAVVFRELGSARERGERTPADSARIVAQLEGELRSTKQHLQTTIEELETSNEELKSSNEELLSMNEELQSLNEEFETVNAELKRKVEELDSLNSDLDNLLRSTQIPTLFLDEELKIRRFTPAAADVFHVIDTDLGRPIMHLAPRFHAAHLPREAQEVLRTLRSKEREVVLDEGRIYLMRITPYRTISNVIDGVVVTFLDITQVKAAEEQRARLAAIVESASEAIIAKTLDGTVTSWNHAAELAYGWKAEEMIGRSIATIMPPERVSELDQVLDNIRRGQRVPRYETERVRKDGHRITVSLTISPVLDSAGRVTGASAIARDISDQKAAETALRASEQRYRSLVAATAAVVWTSDATGALVADQPTWERFTGQTRDQLLGWGWLDAVHPEDRQRVQEAWRRAVSERSSYELGFRVWNAALHDFRHVQARAVPVLGDDGQAREWIGMLADVTTEREALDALHARADELRVIFDNSSAGLIECDANDAILRANRKFSELTGREPEALVGMRLSELGEGSPAPGLFQSALAAGPSGHSGEWRLVNPDGSAIHLQISASILKNPGNASERVIAVLQDISERKRTELELTRAKQAAEAASRAKDQFLAVLSHELRTPLTPVLAAAHKLERTESLSEDGKKTLQMVRRNVDLEARLIDDLLDLTRISRGRMELRPDVVDASAVMVQALEIVSIDLDAKNLKLESKLESGCFVKADAARLHQVFWNLLKNAIKFTPPGGTLRLSCRRDGAGEIVAEVSDTGIGIESQLLPYVFDAFEQGTRAREGLGLGLAICRALVELHGGQISAESAGPGMGATFRVTLPETHELAVRTPKRNNDTPAEQKAAALSVLLVEDHADSAQLMRELLELSGHRVAQAASLAEAISIADSSSFDLLLSDLGLPDGSGLELVQQLRAAGKVKHAIALSGYGMEEDLRRSREAGFEEHLVKPISPRDLDATIRRVVR